MIPPPAPQSIPSPPTSAPKSDALPYACILFTLALLLISQSRIPNILNFATLIITLLQTAAIVALFWLSALGYALPIRKLLPHTINHWTLQAALGAAILSLGAWAAAHFPIPTPALFLITPGLIILIHHALKTGALKSNKQLTLPTLSPYITLFAFPAGLLLAATTIAPAGGLWPSEFNAYDSLSYHLGLQYDWLQTGAITPLTHNVYSYLPNLTESLYLLIAQTLPTDSLPSDTIRGAAPLAGIASQLLHATFALLTAALITRTVFTLTQKHPPALAAGALYLATPWTLVTGSLAYNEQTMMAFATAALLIILTPSNNKDDNSNAISNSAAFTSGVLIALAALAKLTALPTFALPIGCVLLLRPSITLKQKLAATSLFTLATFITLAPFLIRNYSWTANPLFPMFADTIASAHWTTEQAARWSAAHHPPHPPSSLLHSLRALFTQGPAHLQFAYILFPLTIIAIPIAFKRNPCHPTRHAIIGLTLTLAIQILFWIFMTHQQSRFLIPLLAPATILIGLAFAASIRNADTSNPNPPLGLGLTFAVIIATLTSSALYLTQAPAAPLFIDGARLIQNPIPNIPPLNIYHSINALPKNSNIYSEGFSTPYYVSRPLHYHTVWDTSPLATQLAKAGPTHAHAWLLEQNYTHLLIDHAMLALWTTPQNYGYDPNFNLQQLQSLTATLQPIAHFPPDNPAQSLYKITPLTTPLTTTP